jgi:hypothetical protein
MLGDLKGEDEFQDLFHTLKNILPNQTPVRIESLIKAWGRLFGQGTEHFSILHCFSPEAAEPYMEVSEAKTGKRPVRLVRLPLPHCSACPDDFSAKKERWHHDNAAWIAELKTCLENVIEKGLEAVPLATFSQLAGQWAAQVDQAALWPALVSGKDCGPPALEIYLLGAGIKPLTASLCNIKDTTDTSTAKYSLLAVVSSRPNSCS